MYTPGFENSLHFIRQQNIERDCNQYIVLSFYHREKMVIHSLTHSLTHSLARSLALKKHRS